MTTMRYCGERILPSRFRRILTATCVVLLCVHAWTSQAVGWMPSAASGIRAKASEGSAVYVMRGHAHNGCGAKSARLTPVGGNRHAAARREGGGRMSSAGTLRPPRVLALLGPAFLSLIHISEPT